MQMKREKTKLTKEIAVKVLQTVDCGLSSGLGNPKPGEMCIEAAVSFALGEGHNDNPSCVGSAVRAFKIRLNDATWSSNLARAAGMREIAIAQLGSDTIDQVEFAKLIALRTITTILPAALRAAATPVLEKEVSDLLLEHALKCAWVTSLEDGITEAESAARAVSSLKGLFLPTCTKSAARAAKLAAEWAAKSAGAAKSATWLTGAAKLAESAEWAESAESAMEPDSVLTLAANLCLSVLKQLKSPGCEWLSICATNNKEF